MILYIISNSLQAQKIVSPKPQNRPVVLEVFTGIKCVYCPDGHRIAKDIYNKNPFNTVWINIHEGSFAVPSAGQPDFRTPFGTAIAAQTGLTGYPSGTINRHKFDSNTNTALGRTEWTNAAQNIRSLPTPVNVGVKSTFDATTRELSIDASLIYTDASPAAKNYIHVAFLQNGVIGPQTGGANPNSYEHNNILRHLITGQWGQEISNTTKGAIHDLNFKYTVPSQYDIDKCDVVVFVSESRQEIYNGKKVAANGGVTVISGEITNKNPYTIVEKNSTNELSIDLKSELPFEDTFLVNIVQETPFDWGVTATIGNQTINDGDLISFTAEELKSLKVNVSSNENKGIAKITVKLTPIHFPNSEQYTTTSYLISQVKDLIISHVNNVTYAENYVNGLGVADNKDNLSIPEDLFFEIKKATSISGFKNIYYNVGWSFPSLSAEMVEYLTNFLDNGGNLFIAGQDIGWDTWDPTGRSGHAKNFYTNYLKTKYINDGAATTAQYIAITSDPIFGDLGVSGINDVYGSNNKYPEILQPLTGAEAIFKYEGNIGVGGIRVESDKNKIVYLGINLEQMINEGLRYDLVKRAHDWFYGLVSSNEDIIETNSVMIYPNPTSEKLNISNESELEFNHAWLLSIDGSVISSINIAKGLNEMNIENLNSGSYFIKLLNDKTGKATVSKIQIVK
jgi:hypothetical protein